MPARPKALSRRRARPKTRRAPGADSSGLTTHPHPLARTPALTSALDHDPKRRTTMTTVIDPWAITDHDEAQALPSHGEVAHPQRSHDREPEHDKPSEVDELAVVQVAHDGLRLRLRGAERD